MIRIVKTQQQQPIAPRLTEADIDTRIKCAILYTDITVLSQCMVTFLYDLTSALTSEGAYKQENKLAVNRATNRAVNIVNEINDEMININRIYVKSYTELYDQLIAELDKNILLHGSERSLSMIDTVGQMIADKLTVLHRHRHTFSEMACVENMPLVAKDIRCIAGQRYDLEPIIRPILRKMITDKEYEEAKRKYMEYYHITPNDNGRS